DDLPDGEYFVAMELDYTNVIEESDETDNWLFDADTLFLQGPEPIAIDLAPSGVVASESAVTVGASTDVEVTINNLGPSDAGAYSVRFYYSSDHDITVNDVLLCTVNEAGLAANSATVVQDQCVVPELDG